MATPATVQQVSEKHTEYALRERDRLCYQADGYLENAREAFTSRGKHRAALAVLRQANELTALGFYADALRICSELRIALGMGGEL